MATKWTREQQAAAQAQGWGLFVAHRYGGRQYELQRLDDPTSVPRLGYDEPRFADDEAAADYVQRQADNGCPLAQAAIRFLIEQQAPDVERFGLRLESEG